MKAIAMVKPGTRFRDVGDVISKHAKLNGCVSCSAFWMHTHDCWDPACKLLELLQAERGEDVLRTWDLGHVPLCTLDPSLLAE